MKKHYIFPPELADDAKIATIKTIGKCHRVFRCNLNKDYVVQGLTPFNRIGFIMPNEWTECVSQQTSEEASPRNRQFKELNKKNKYKHFIGPGGYKAKIPK